MSKARILIVEDSRTQAESLSWLLSENDYDVTAAASANEALSLMDTHKFDVVISDIMMPGMSGYELCNTLKSRAKWRDIPVILLTSLSDPMDVIRGLECGADNFVTKPYLPEPLLERIAHVLDNRRLRHSKLQVGLSVNFLGQRFTITADKEQILDLLISTFEDAVIQNKQLLAREEELERAKAELSSYAGALEERIERVLESVPDIVYSVSADRREIFYISPACTRLLGFTPQQFAEDPRSLWERAVAPEHRARVRQTYERVVSTGEQATIEYPIIGPDGSARSLEETIVPRRDQNGSLVRLDGVARDITERRRLEEQVRLAQKMEAVGTLAGGVAHDFNNLLTAIRGNAELALLEISEDNPAREDLIQIGELVDRATAVTRQLLAFGRKQVLEPQAVDLNELISNSTSMLRRFIGADIDLRTIFTDEAATIWADANQIDQVLMNLSLNSRHAMRNGGELTISTSRVTLDETFHQLHPWATPGDYVLLTVSDTGTGMPPEVVARIFEPFFTTKDPGQGTGLGLSVVYGIVKQHGGLIHVYSEPGRGTTFRLYFPSYEAGVEVPPAAVATEVIGGGGETILFVEDEDAVRVMAVKQLRRLGYHVLEATNGVQALELLGAHAGKVDLVMLDVVMPVMGGPEAYEEIIRRFPDLKFLFMTGYSPSTSHLSPLSGIPGQILHKPFGLKDLAAAVERALGRQAL